MKQKRHTKNIMVVTGTRADYGVLTSVLHAIDAQKNLNMKVLITGMHLLKSFGYTAKEVIDDGWNIAGRVPLQTENDDIIGHAKATGKAITKMVTLYEQHKTDIVLLLGDRLEMFTAAAAASASQLYMAHIHGGDVAMGIQDDAWRHTITKLSHIHFPASKGAYRRLIKLGEHPDFIYQTGSPAIDNLSKNICKNISTFNDYAGFDTNQDFMVILHHPSGFPPAIEKKHMLNLLRTCHSKHLPLIILRPNSDPGSSGIIQACQSFTQKTGHPFITHLPRAVYLGFLAKCRILAGNSSSGIIEAGRLNVDVLNVGPRQTGRDRGKHVIDTSFDPVEMSEKLDMILNTSNRNRKPSTVYGDGNSGIKIADILAKIKLNANMKQKVITY